MVWNIPTYKKWYYNIYYFFRKKIDFHIGPTVSKNLQVLAIMAVKFNHTIQQFLQFKNKKFISFFYKILWSTQFVSLLQTFQAKVSWVVKLEKTVRTCFTGMIDCSIVNVAFTVEKKWIKIKSCFQLGCYWVEFERIVDPRVYMHNLFWIAEAIIM